MKTSNHRYGYVVLLILVSVLTFTGCKKKSDNGPSSSSTLTVADNAKYIKPADWTAYVTSVDSATGTITCSNQLVQTSSLAVGDIIVTSSGDGFLRMITQISNSAGGAVIQTAEATLTDLVTEGTIEYSASLSKSQVSRILYHYPGVSLDTASTKSTGGDFVWNIDVPFGAGVELTGQMSCNWGYSMKVVIKPTVGIEEARFGYTANENSNLELTAGAGFQLEESTTLASVTFFPFLVPLPPTPFVMVVKPQVDLVVGISGAASANVSTGIGQSLGYTAEIRYLDGSGWAPSMTIDTSQTFTPPTLTANAQATAYVTPELSFKLFNVAGPYINAKTYARVTAGLNQEPWWKFFIGMQVDAGARAAVLSKTLFDYKIDGLVRWERLVDQAKSIKGTWYRSSDGLKVVVDGASGAFADFGTSTWTYAAAQGFVSIGNLKFQGFSHTGGNIWTCSELWMKWQDNGSGGLTVLSVDWSGGYAELSADGNTLTAVSNDPYQGGLVYTYYSRVNPGDLKPVLLRSGPGSGS